MPPRGAWPAPAIVFLLCCSGADPVVPAPDDWSLVPPSARATMQEAIERCRQSPRDAACFAELARTYHGNEQIDLAAACYGKAITLGSTDAATHHLLGLIHLQRGRATEAIEELRRATELEPSYAPTQYNLGQALLDAARIEEAVSAFRRAAQLGPNSASFHAGLGRGLRQAGRLQEAEGALRRALQIDPGDAEAHQLLGLTLQAQGRSEEARAHLDRVVHYSNSIVSDPWLREVQQRASTPAILIDRARGFLALGRTDSALDVLAEAASAYPDSAAIFRLLGEAYVRAGQPQQAVDAYVRATDLEPGDPEAHAALAVILSEHGKSDEAAREVELALRARPGHALATIVKANLAIRSGRPAEALELILPVVQERADLVTAHVVHGEALERLHRLDQAVAAFSRAVELAPGSEYPRRRLEEVRRAAEGSGP